MNCSTLCWTLYMYIRSSLLRESRLLLICNPTRAVVFEYWKEDVRGVFELHIEFRTSSLPPFPSSFHLFLLSPLSFPSHPPPLHTPVPRRRDSCVRRRTPETLAVWSTAATAPTTTRRWYDTHLPITFTALRQWIVLVRRRRLSWSLPLLFQDYCTIVQTKSLCT